MTLILSWLTSKLAGPIATGLAVILAICLAVSRGQIDGLRLQLADLKLSNATELAQATEAASRDQAARDKITLTTAVAEAEAQKQIITRTVTLIQKVPTYVSPETDSRICVPYGVVRLLDAATLQTSPDAFPLPTGQSDESCSPVEASALAKGVIENYLNVCEANSEQLTQLQFWVKEQGGVNGTRRGGN
jgi:hypothetical protein